MKRVLPVVTEIAGRFPERTVFTRFITPLRPNDLPGAWRRYYERSRETTRGKMDPGLLELVDPRVPRTRSSHVSPAGERDRQEQLFGLRPAALPASLRRRGADGLIVTGSETDICVLATVLGAVDAGYPVILMRGAVCSSSDEGHDALMQIYCRRYSEQIEVADAEAILAHWR